MVDRERRPLAVAILAAGKGKRMGNPDKAKVLAPLHDRPLLAYVLDQARVLDPSHVVVIVGHQREAVQSFVAGHDPSAVCVVQSEQLGTGHAVQQTRTELGDKDVDILILSGDVPLLTAETLEAFLQDHRTAEADISVLTTTVSDPTGYGRIVRDADGNLRSIVEHKDASEAQRAIGEINSGIYIVRSADLFPALDRVRNGNVQGEYYLTDIIGILQADGKRVHAYHTPNWEELHGINTMDDLQRAADMLALRDTTA